MARLKAQSWYIEVADLVARNSNLSLRRAAESLGIQLTMQEAELHEKRKAWQQALDAARWRVVRRVALRSIPEQFECQTVSGVFSTPGGPSVVENLREMEKISRKWNAGLNSCRLRPISPQFAGRGLSRVFSTGRAGQVEHFLHGACKFYTPIS